MCFAIENCKTNKEFVIITIIIIIKISWSLNSAQFTFKFTGITKFWTVGTMLGDKGKSQYSRDHLLMRTGHYISYFAKD